METNDFFEDVLTFKLPAGDLGDLFSGPHTPAIFAPQTIPDLPEIAFPDDAANVSISDVLSVLPFQPTPVAWKSAPPDPATAADRWARTIDLLADPTADPQEIYETYAPPEGTPVTAEHFASALEALAKHSLTPVQTDAVISPLRAHLTAIRQATESSNAHAIIEYLRGTLSMAVDFKLSTTTIEAAKAHYSELRKTLTEKENNAAAIPPRGSSPRIPESATRLVDLLQLKRFPGLPLTAFAPFGGKGTLLLPFRNTPDAITAANESNPFSVRVLHRAMTAATSDGQNAKHRHATREGDSIGILQHLSADSFDVMLSDVSDIDIKGTPAIVKKLCSTHGLKNRGNAVSAFEFTLKALPILLRPGGFHVVVTHSNALPTEAVQHSDKMRSVPILQIHIQDSNQSATANNTNNTNQSTPDPAPDEPTSTHLTFKSSPAYALIANSLSRTEEARATASITIFVKVPNADATHKHSAWGTDFPQIVCNAENINTALDILISPSNYPHLPNDVQAAVVNLSSQIQEANALRLLRLAQTATTTALQNEIQIFRKRLSKPKAIRPLARAIETMDKLRSFHIPEPDFIQNAIERALSTVEPADVRRIVNSLSRNIQKPLRILLKALAPKSRQSSTDDLERALAGAKKRTHAIRFGDAILPFVLDELPLRTILGLLAQKYGPGPNAAFTGLPQELASLGKLAYPFGLYALSPAALASLIQHVCGPAHLLRITNRINNRFDDIKPLLTGSQRLAAFQKDAAAFCAAIGQPRSRSLLDAASRAIASGTQIPHASGFTHPLIQAFVDLALEIVANPPVKQIEAAAESKRLQDLIKIEAIEQRLMKLSAASVDPNVPTKEKLKAIRYALTQTTHAIDAVRIELGLPAREIPAKTSTPNARTDKKKDTPQSGSFEHPDANPCQNRTYTTAAAQSNMFPLAGQPTLYPTHNPKSGLTL